MADEIRKLEAPIDVMLLIHKALRAQAAQAVKAAEQVGNGGSLQGFKLVFNSWATALVFHAEQEDIYITQPLTISLVSLHSENGLRGTGKARPEASALPLVERVKAAMLAQEDEQHRELLEAMEDVLKVLSQDIGKTTVITRTKQHLYRQVVTLRIVQEDHLEAEEALVLPLVRERLSERQQLEAARGLLLDKEAQDPRWVIDWVEQELAPAEQRLLADMEARFKGLPSPAR